MKDGNIQFQWLGKQVDFYKDPWFRFKRVFTLLDRYISINPGSKCLDVGCQIGQFLKLMQANYGVSPSGIDDYDKTNVVKICKKYLQLDIAEPHVVINESWNYYTRRIDQVGFDIDIEFDIVTALEVIEHIVDTDMFLEECRSHIKEDGYLVISTPNINSLRNRIQVFFGVYPSGMEYRTVNHHVRLYNLKVLTSHAEEHGFALLGSIGVSFLPRCLVKNKFMNKIDAWLADYLPSFCGNIIVLFSVRPKTCRGPGQK